MSYQITCTNADQVGRFIIYIFYNQNPIPLLVSLHLRTTSGQHSVIRHVPVSVLRLWYQYFDTVYCDGIILFNFVIRDKLLQKQ